MPITADEQNKVTWIILKLAEKYQLGKGTLALFLKGSRSKILKPREFDKKKGFGALFWHDLSDIKIFLNKLEASGLLKREIVHEKGYFYPYPILVLTELGKNILIKKEDAFPYLQKVSSPDKEYIPKLGDSERVTLSLLMKGKTVAEIAQQRILKESTIYTHFVHLISCGELRAKECISESVLTLISEARKGYKKRPRLKELKEKLPESISYEEIRCVVEDFEKNETK